jgi:hypothetical protein
MHCQQFEAIFSHQICLINEKLIIENRGTKIWSAWQKLRIICHFIIPMHKQHIVFPKCSIFRFCTAFPMTGISSEHLFCSSCWEGYTGGHILG